MKIRCLVFLLMAFALSTSAQTTKSGIAKENMDVSVRPGNDFFRYSVGGWLKSHPIPQEYSKYGQFAILNKQNNERIRDLIIEMSNQNFANGTDQQKIGDLYNLMMDSTRLNRDGAKPILP